MDRRFDNINASKNFLPTPAFENLRTIKEYHASRTYYETLLNAFRILHQNFSV